MTVSYQKVMKFTMARLSLRASMFLKGNYICALYLTPAYRYIACSKKFKLQTIHKHIMMKAVQMFRLNTRECDSLQQALDHYHDGINDYADCDENETALQYWERKDQKSALARYCVALLGLIPTSASVERLFSKLARTKTNYRNRMKVETLSSAGKIKLDVINSNALDKKGQFGKGILNSNHRNSLKRMAS